MKTLSINIITVLLTLSMTATANIDSNLYPTTEPTVQFENWMFEALDTSVEPGLLIEDWMLEELTSVEAEPIVEGWMLDTLDDSSEEIPVIEDWMLEELEIEEGPVLEEWMFDKDTNNKE